MIRRHEYKGLGICRDLVNRRIAICKEIGCDKIYTAVYHKRKGLIKLYRELGFKEIEAITPEYIRLEYNLHNEKIYEERYKGGCSV
jgi:GNAT superfamily N-acetyltransferase